ncbi:MAG: methyltransferase, partial [Ruminococcus sp.]|nr:methyltransferase [Ruminococcus sp.]
MIEFIGRSDRQVKLRGHRIELAEIESVLLKQDGVSGAVVEIIGDKPENYKLQGAVVPNQKAVLPSEPDKEEAEALDTSILENTSHIDKALFDKWNDALDDIVVTDVYLLLKKYGFFTKEKQTVSYQEMLSVIGVPEKLHKLFYRWLQMLCREGVLSQNGLDENASFTCLKTIEDSVSAGKWEALYEMAEKLENGKKILDYMKISHDNLAGLITGEKDPLDYLFPHGNTDVAVSIYHDNIINQALNKIARDEIAFLAKKKNRKVRILEIGAGVGGTSMDVIPALDNLDVEYYFTDLSEFFFNKAKEQFGDRPWIRYQIFDINQDYTSQGIDPFSFDIILSANVLHNASNIDAVMEKLKSLLTDDGCMVIIDETKEAYNLLTTMEFKNGLTGFEDGREENHQTFIFREQWEKILSAHSAEVIREFPQAEEALSSSDQTIFVAHFRQEYENLDTELIKEHLKNNLPEYMVPSYISVMPSFPVTRNGKIDRAEIKRIYQARMELTRVETEDTEEKTDLEKRMAEIWCEELKIHTISKHDNFYLVGGDSLLIAQVIAKMKEKLPEAKEWEWDELLQEMMQTPNVYELSMKLESGREKENLPENNPCFVSYKRSTKPNSESKALVLMHAGTGTLSSYNGMLPYLMKVSPEDESIFGFRYGDEAEYLSIPAKDTFKVLGKKYADLLMEMGYTEYHLIGHCVGGSLSLETAQQLRKMGANVSEVTIISTHLLNGSLASTVEGMNTEMFHEMLTTSMANELLMERTFARLIDADIYEAGYTVRDDELQKYIEFVGMHNNGQVTVSALCEDRGEFQNCVAEFSRLAKKSKSERLNALYQTIKKPNGEVLEHQLKMLNTLFNIFVQNFTCVATYVPEKYYGKMRVFECENSRELLFPELVAEDRATWEPFGGGEFEFGTLKGAHLTCVRHPFIDENIYQILKMTKEELESL